MYSYTYHSLWVVLDLHGYLETLYIISQNHQLPPSLSLVVMMQMTDCCKLHVAIYQLHVLRCAVYSFPRKTGLSPSLVTTMQGRIQDFKLGGAHLKKLRRAEGGAKIFVVFRVNNYDFTPKNHIFSNCGERRENFWGNSCESAPAMQMANCCKWHYATVQSI